MSVHNFNVKLRTTGRKDEASISSGKQAFSEFEADINIRSLEFSRKAFTIKGEAIKEEGDKIRLELSVLNERGRTVAKAMTLR